MNTFQKRRKTLVEKQILDRGIRNPLIVKAMLQVPREQFVSLDYREEAYEDKPLPIDEGQTISQPYIVAYMIELLQTKKDGKYLEIGSGSGYSAAVLSRIVSKVFSVERHSVLARTATARLKDLGYTNIKIKEGDGTLGWLEEAPFDGIIVTAGGPGVPRILLNQLAIGGRMVIPVGPLNEVQDLCVIKRLSEIEFQQENLGHVQFVPLIGAQGWHTDL